MLAFLAWMILIFFLGLFGFFNLSKKIWMPSIGILLFLYTFFHILSLPSLIILWILWGFMAIFLFFTPLRYQIFTRWFIQWFKKQQPDISPIEQQVLDAGGLWFEQEFFKDKPNWDRLFQINTPQLTEEEKHFLDHQVETLCDMLNDWESIQKKRNLPDKAWEYIKKEKFWGLEISKEYGGHGFSAIAHSAVITKIASKSYSAALTVMVPNSVGLTELIYQYGTKKQKDYYVPRLVSGEEIACFALTSPYAGSDASNIIDSGIIRKQVFEGKEIIGIQLNWSKRYITLAPMSTLIGLAFQLSDPNHLLGEKEHIGITLAIVPSALPGVEIGRRHNPLHLNFLNGPIQGKDVFIPLDYVIGGRERCGAGWEILMECLSVGRGISLPALSSAFTQLCFRTSGAYALVREQFHRSIGSFEGIKLPLAKIGGFNYLCEAVRLFTALAVQSGVRPAIASAITKYHVTELSQQAVKHAMDIHGGRGIQLGPRNYLGELVAATSISITVEGANILTRNLIIFGQGALRCHPHLRHEISAAAHPEKSENIKRFDQLILSHAGSLISQTIKTLLYGMSGGHFIRIRQNKIFKKYLRQFTRMSVAFRMVSDISFAVIGTQLKIKEALSARLGDILSHLYLASATMKYYFDNGQTTYEKKFLQWSLDYCLYQIQKSFFDFFENFPKPWIANIMRFFIFPWGRKFIFPADQNSFDIANFMQKISDGRNQLTQYVYMNRELPNDPVAKVENAMECFLKASSLFKKLSCHYNQQLRISKLAKIVKNAYNDGIITENEQEQLLEVHRVLNDVIQVDEFDDF